MSQPAALLTGDSQVAIDFISTRMKELTVGAPSTAKRAHTTALSADGLHAVLLRVVATGSAEQLACCSGVCRMWYEESTNPELWKLLLLWRWGEGAQHLIESLPPGSREAAMTYRALFIRSLTTQVLSWGQGARSEEEVATAPRTPALLLDGLRRVGIKAVAAGLGFTCALTWGGKVMCWGANTSGQCGVSCADSPYVEEPVELDLGDHFGLAVSCGQEHAACVSASGMVLVWGSNSMDQLGQTRGAATPLLPSGAPVPSPASLHEAVRPWFRRRGFGLRRTHAALQAHRTPHFTAVACGHAHNVALTSDGAVFAWGSNSLGQCGPGSTVDDCAIPAEVEAACGIRVRAVAAGGAFSLLVTDEGILSMGANSFGQLGRETEAAYDAVPDFVEMPQLSGSGGVTGDMGENQGEGGDAEVWVKDLKCGEDHALMALSDGAVYVWGRGTQGALGLGSETKNMLQPVAVARSGEVKAALSMGRHGDVRVAAGGAASAILSNSVLVGGPLGPVAVAAAQRAAAKAAEAEAEAAAGEGGGRGEAGDASGGLGVAGAMQGGGAPVCPTYCLSAARESTLYSWGANKYSELGHGDVLKKTVCVYLCVCECVCVCVCVCM